ncbi:MAG: SCO family protein [Planctomycetota bacterium]
MIKSKQVIIIVLIMVLVVAGILAGNFYITKAASNELPIIEKASDFKLVNQDNEEIHLSQFQGKAVVMSFIYIRCTAPRRCPLTTKNFRRIQELLGEQYADRVVLLLVSFDPASDEPGALKKYGELYEADFTNWHFLSGTKETIDKVCADYQIIIEKEKDDSIRHSLITFLIDQDNNVRRMYFANEWKPEKIKEDIITLLNEAKK